MQWRRRHRLCNGGDIRNVVTANDTRAAASYAPAMTDRIGREHTMKRIATIGAVVTAFAVAPSLAAGGGFAAEVKAQVSARVVGAQVSAQVVGAEITNAQIAQAPRAQTAVSVQRHLVQIKLARRFAELRPQIR
jgi:hypothetical protein